jgi:hypothetical protein
MIFIIIAIAVVAIIVVTHFLRNGKSKNPARSLPVSPRPLLRQFGDLHRQDFEEHPVWVNCHIIDYDEPWYDETDEETFRPWTKNLPVDPTTMFLVKATLTLADGTEMSGFVTPQNPDDSGGKVDLGLIQPQVFLPDDERVGFWFGILMPSPEEVASLYSALDKTQRDVFPIAFMTNESLATGITSGSIPGFCSRGENDEVKVTK